MSKVKLPRCKPETQQVSPQSIVHFVQALETAELEVHSFILVRNGHVIAEGTWDPYDHEDPHVLNSLSKSFTSTAIGLAIEEGKLSLDDKVISFFPEHVTPAVRENMESLKIRHLLSMSTGHKEDTTPLLRSSYDWTREFLQTPIEYEPGTHFLYNTGATYMLSAILTKATGEKLLDYLQPRLFEPLGMEGITTTTCPRGIHFGGAGMKVKIEDIAKFGLLYLQKGKWEGKQIIPEHWVEVATKKQIDNGNDPDNDWAQGYGYQFWRCRHGAYRGDGAFGQYCVVLPEQNAVVAITSGVMEMSAILDLVWEHLLLGMNMSSGSRIENLDLEETLASLAYKPPVAQKTSPHMARCSGKQYEVQPNKAGITAVSYAFSDQDHTFTYWDSQGTGSFSFGTDGKWRITELLFGGEQVKVAAAGTWKKLNQLELTLRLLGTPFCDKWNIDFTNDGMRLRVSRNIWHIPGLSDTALFPDLVGHMYKSE